MRGARVRGLTRATDRAAFLRVPQTLKVAHDAAKGPTWARAKAESLLGDEEFYLQVSRRKRDWAGVSVGRTGPGRRAKWERVRGNEYVGTAKRESHRARKEG